MAAPSDPLGIIQVLIAMVAGLLIKIVYDWLTAGQKYVTLKDCQTSKLTCPTIANLKVDFLEHKTQMKGKIHQMDKDISITSNSFQSVSETMASMKTDLAVITAWIQNKDKECTKY